jgi:hypothetical protein
LTPALAHGFSSGWVYVAGMSPDPTAGWAGFIVVVQ